MNNMLEKFRWLWTHFACLLIVLILVINPKHVEEFAHAHQTWSGIIMGVWTLVYGWAVKNKPAAMAQEQQLKIEVGQKQIGRAHV